MLKAYMALPGYRQADIFGQVLAAVAVIAGTVLYFT